MISCSFNVENSKTAASEGLQHWPRLWTKNVDSRRRFKGIDERCKEVKSYELCSDYNIPLQTSPYSLFCLDHHVFDYILFFNIQLFQKRSDITNTAVHETSACTFLHLEATLPCLKVYNFQGQVKIKK